MKTLYLECNMGAAGDMLMSALLELHPDPDGFIARMNALNLPGVVLCREDSVKCGVHGTHISVTVDGQEELPADHHHHDAHHHEHHHADLSDICGLINGLDLPETVRSNAIEVYNRIAAAEAHVHGIASEHIHFHEVGTLDAVADVVGVCLLMHELAPEQVVVSPIHVGSGQVHCAHGLLPVPAPATAWLLRNAPVYGGEIRGELCTPTGAALLTHFAVTFGPMPAMIIRAVGYGMGFKDFPAANCVRAILGDTAETAPNEQIVRLECNLDDMTGEAVGYAVDRLFAAGARDVFLQPIQMKKNRPGQLLCVICGMDDADQLARLMLLHTTTLGVRRENLSRYALNRRIEVRPTPFGDVRYKISEGFGVQKSKPEYADLEAIALREGVPLSEVLRKINS